MLTLTNTTEQILEPGESITFDRVLLHTGCCPRAERHRPESANVELVNGKIFNIDFSANIAGEAAGAIQLAVFVEGEAISTSTMISTPAAANELNNVARPGLKIRRIGCSDTISVRNNGTTNIILPARSAYLSIRRDA